MHPEHPEPIEKSILLADQEVFVRHALAEYLRSCGCHVVELGSTDEAMEILTEMAESVTAVLCRTDVTGALSAVEMADCIRSEHPEITVLLADTVEEAASAAGQLCDEAEIEGPSSGPAVLVERFRRRLAARDRTRGG